MKLKFIHIEKNRQGEPAYYYFRRGRCERIRLPESPGSELFSKAYNAALNNLPIHIPTPLSFDDKRKHAVEKALKKSLCGARQRSSDKNKDFDLTLDWLLDQVERQDFKCALTGIPFFAPHAAASMRNPYAPSIDRIDSRRGYTKDNVRVVIFALNVMLSDWGHQIFERVASHYKRNKNRTSIPERRILLPKRAANN